jgi:hypothetical protein
MNSPKLELEKITVGNFISENNEILPEFESFDAFGPRAYLEEYYSKIDHENEELLKFFAKGYSDIQPVKSVLEFSGGPTIYSLISAVPKAQEIHFSDFLKHNRHEVRRWKKGHRKAFDWKHFVKRALELEGMDEVSDNHVDLRHAELKTKITKIVKANAFRKFSLKHNNFEHYDVVSVNFVPESITAKRHEWEKAIKNICSLVKPGGYLFITSLKNSKYYILDGKKFPAVHIDEHDLLDVLHVNGFDISSVLLNSIKAKPYRGYEGMVFIRAQKYNA